MWNEAEWKTPIEKLMNDKDASIYVKRDDIIPYSYGGNKVRIAAELFRDAKDKSCTAMVSYGSLDSNLNRVVASMAADAGMPCYLITSLTDEEMETYQTELQTGNRQKHRNELLADQTGAERILCRKNEVKQCVENTLNRLREHGLVPYYVYGDSSGKGNEAVTSRAYEKAYEEIRQWEKQEGLLFDYMVTAYGTGTTLTGLQQGRKRLGGSEEIVGISIARNAPEGRNDIIDRYLGGGYGQRDDTVEQLIGTMAEQYQLCLDPIYTAKAFHGMLEEIRQGRLSGNILFIHTGGYPIYQEYMEKRERKS